MRHARSLYDTEEEKEEEEEEEEEEVVGEDKEGDEDIAVFSWLPL